MSDTPALLQCTSSGNFIEDYSRGSKSPYLAVEGCANTRIMYSVAVPVRKSRIYVYTMTLETGYAGELISITSN